MSKKQKILSWIFIGLFVIPEVLWSPLLNFYYELNQSGSTSAVHSLRDNFFENPDHFNSLRLIVFIQLVGLVSFLVLLTRIKLKLRLVAILITIVLILLSVIANWYMSAQWQIG